MLIQPIDHDALRERVRQAQPFPFFCVDNFLDEAFADQVHNAFPSFEEAARIGRMFSAVNERKKIQVTDKTRFPEPIAKLNQALADPGFCQMLSTVFTIPQLLPDEELVGGGIHETGARGHLDVHVDFNYIEDRQLHRRLNILVYFNKGWKPEWGGNIELWDRDVKVCHHSLSPIFNRCVVFETSEISYHGVMAVRCPDDQSRKSFAAYYYTKESPPSWNGSVHSTNFRARPDEVLKGSVLMPLERAGQKLRSTAARLKKIIRGKKTITG
jgi:Rps23 Pro-64 3,4-dihydroxylase Tpa1-like proline 4-hydroxylase